MAAEAPWGVFIRGPQEPRPNAHLFPEDQDILGGIRGEPAAPRLILEDMCEIKSRKVQVTFVTIRGEVRMLHPLLLGPKGVA